MSFHRISVGSLKENILGACLICGSSFDDYSSRCRCSHCRMLVLVCPTCQVESNAIFFNAEWKFCWLSHWFYANLYNCFKKLNLFFKLQDSTKEYACELCQKNGKEPCQISTRQDCQIQIGLSESFEKPSISYHNVTSKVPWSDGKVCISFPLHSLSDNYLYSYSNMHMALKLQK
jgi:hypothetical protein